MKKIYKEILNLALPYLKKGRQGDVEHIKWMLGEAEKVCKKESLDESIILPVVILHDIGYGIVKKDNPFKLTLRKEHMKKGAILAAQILKKVNYPENKAKIITYYISVHDNWALNDHSVYKKNKLLGIFNDLDYIWMFTPKGFNIVRKFKKFSKQQMLAYLQKNSFPEKGFYSSKTTESIHKKYFKQIEKHKT